MPLRRCRKVERDALAREHGRGSSAHHARNFAGPDPRPVGRRGRHLGRGVELDKHPARQIHARHDAGLAEHDWRLPAAMRIDHRVGRHVARANVFGQCTAHNHLNRLG